MARGTTGGTTTQPQDSSNNPPPSGEGKCKKCVSSVGALKCDTDTGVCTCKDGYTGDNCTIDDNIILFFQIFAGVWQLLVLGAIWVSYEYNNGLDGWGVLGALTLGPFYIGWKLYEGHEGNTPYRGGQLGGKRKKATRKGRK